MGLKAPAFRRGDAYDLPHPTPNICPYCITLKRPAAPWFETLLPQNIYEFGFT